MLFHPIILSLLLPFIAVYACTPPPSNSSDSPFELGNDGPADPATIGYTLNHFALNVNNLTASANFYRNVLGMRHVFTFHASKDYTFAYYGFSHGGKNGTGFQPGDELYREKNNIEGLLELQEFRESPATGEALTASSQVVNTFSHIGLIVPDINATQARMEEYGVKILKRIGEDVNDASSPVGTAFRLRQASAMAAKEIIAGINALGFKDFLIVADPDGNILEIQRQVL